MKPRLQWLLSAFALWAGMAAAREEGGVLWQGTLGTQQIVVEQTGNLASTSDCGGRYFYRRHRIDIRLDGKRSMDGGCALQELPPRWNEDTPKDQWRMRAPVGDHWQGEWVGTNGKTHPIRLRKVTALPAAVEPSLTALRGDIDPYAYLRLSTLKLQPGKRETINGFTLQWLQQPDTDLRLFDVASGYPAKAQAAVNQTLHRRLWQWVEDDYQCRSGAEPGEAGFDSTETTLRHIDARVVSVSLLTAYYCGGAHPDFGDAPLNIDARNGEELKLEDVLWLGQGDPVHEGVNELDRAWAAYRQEVFAPWVVSQFSRLYPDEMRAPASDDDCDYRDPGVWDYTSWYVLPAGLHLAAYFPRVARNCDDPDWAVLPWSVVDAHRGKVRLH